MKEFSHGVLVYNNDKIFESSLAKQVFVFDQDNPNYRNYLVHLKKHEEGSFDYDNPSTVLPKRGD